MAPWSTLLLCLTLLLVGRSGPIRVPEEARDIREMDLGFRGPATPAAEQEVDEVRIGLVLPTEGPAAVAAREIVRGAADAARALNEAGGVGGRPVRLVVPDLAGPWSRASSGIVGLVHEERVWAVVSGLDGKLAHLALQICSKAHTPLLVAAVDDESVLLSGAPWIFRLAARPSPPRRSLHALAGDALRLVVAGLRERGLDRTALRAWLAEVEDFPGATGPIAFCPHGARRGEPGCPP